MRNNLLALGFDTNVISEVGNGSSAYLEKLNTVVKQITIVFFVTIAVVSVLWALFNGLYYAIAKNGEKASEAKERTIRSFKALGIAFVSSLAFPLLLSIIYGALIANA